MISEKRNISSLAENKADPFYELFIISLLFSWLPFKAIAYFAPFLGIVWFIFRANSGRTLLRFVSFTLIYCFVVFVYFIFSKFNGVDYILQNSTLFFLTYGSFFVTFSIYRTAFGGLWELEKYIRVVRAFVLFESLLGILQAVIFIIIKGVSFDQSTGDVAQGSLNILSFIDPGANFNNQIYVLNISFLLTFLVPYSLVKKKYVFTCLIGLLSLVFASVLHLFFSLAVAIIVVAIYFNSHLIKISYKSAIVFLSIVFCLSLFFILQPNNTKLIQHYFYKFKNNKSPKTIATYKTIVDLSGREPLSLAFGLGPGQYSSRAGLIGTGKYFGNFNKPKQIPFIDPALSQAFKRNIYPLWAEYSLNPSYGNSTMSRPFYSLLSVLTEFGYVVFILIFILIFTFLRKLKKMYVIAQLEKRTFHSFYALACAVAIAFLVFISFFENYLEVTQAIFPGLLMLNFFNSFLKDQSRSKQSL